jgi:hypothetical protein
MRLAAQLLAAQANSTIEGRVTDTSGASVVGAVITMEDAEGNRRTTVTDEDGGFRISSLSAAKYNIKISARGLSDWTATNVPASMNPEWNPLVAVLEVAPATTTITVGVSPRELATQQLSQELKQRALGVVPNYYVSYEGNPVPLSPMQKFRLAFKTLMDPTMFAGAAITASIQQGPWLYASWLSVRVIEANTM